MADKKTDTEIANAPPAPPPSERVESWKEIAAYLQRDVRTVQRWEKSEALPVYRHMHDKLGTVYAYKAELDAWWNNRRPRLELELERPEEIQLARTGLLARWPLLVGAVAAVAVGVGLWLARPAPLAFQERDWVLITNFENRTGESLLDGTLEHALERELSNSRFVNVVPRERIGDTLQLMKKPLDTAMDAAVGREVCLRDGGIRALLTGRVEKLDTTYLLSVAIVNPANGVTVASLSEEAAGQKELWPTIRGLAHRVRENLGEELSSIQASEQKLERATTPSLRALQLYSQGRGLVDPLTTELKWGPALEFFEQAVAEDPQFASAYLWSGFAYANLRNDDAAGGPHFKRAFELADTTTGHERSFILGSYYWMYLKDNEKAAQAFEAAAQLYPDHYWTTHKLMEIYQELGRHREAVPYAVRRAELRPHDFLTNCQAARALAVWERNPAKARPYVERARALLTPEVFSRDPFLTGWVELFPAYEYWLQGDAEKALAETIRVERIFNTLSGRPRDWFAVHLASFYWALGKLNAYDELARTISDPAWRQILLLWSAFDRGDMKLLKEYAHADFRSRPEDVQVFARAGLLREAQKAISSLENEKKYPVHRLYSARAELALGQGRADEAIALSQEGIRLNPPSDYALPQNVKTLARAYERKGDLSKAIQLLEELSKEKIWAAMFGWEGPASWMEVQGELARLYRKAGREQDAQKIESELRKLLIYADADHPIVRQLKQSQDVAAQPAK